MIGALLGDTVGSRFEFANRKSKQFDMFRRHCRFTDDSVCSIAVAKALIKNYPIKYDEESLNKIRKDITTNLVEYLFKYPDRGYGARFFYWATKPNSNYEPYNSFGNGSAMRVSSVGWLANSEQEILTLAKASAEVSHNHPEGIKGAQAIAMCIYLARKGKSKEEIKEYIYDNFYPILDYLDYDELVSTYKFDETCQGSVPQAIYCFLISESYEDTIRTAVSIGGDTDTICCIAGSIAEAYYQNEETNKIINEFLNMKYLPDEFVDIANKVKQLSKV